MIKLRIARTEKPDHRVSAARKVSGFSSPIMKISTRAKVFYICPGRNPAFFPE
ncbi:Uncharacterized protein dnm_003910 [Desulfonema magnum]|uniref:Uncharacterized protein n=1 Tax=Desulfonema magnum TaxID=45655 RepID=A0A975BF74_9BACT|nr:Uncharacterized protein dnm_003910 [Desulfonema magnum]